MEFGLTVFSGFCRLAFLGVEMVLPGLTCQKLARFGDLKALGIRLIGFHTHEFKHAFNTLLQKLLIKIFSSSGQKEVNLNAVAFREPFTGLFGLQDEVMVAGTEFDLYGFHLRRM